MASKCYCIDSDFLAEKHPGWRPLDRWLDDLPLTLAPALKDILDIYGPTLALSEVQVVNAVFVYLGGKVPFGDVAELVGRYMSDGGEG